VREISEFGELGDFLDPGGDPGPCYAEHVAAKGDVLKAGRFEIHAGGGVEQRPDLVFDGDGAPARFVNAAQGSQERGLAGAVMAGQRDAVPFRRGSLSWMCSETRIRLG